MRADGYMTVVGRSLTAGTRLMTMGACRRHRNFGELIQRGITGKGMEVQ